MMLSNSDWAWMATVGAAIRGDNEGTIAFRRGTVTLSGQAVRIVRGNSMWRGMDSGQTQEKRGDVIVLGGTALDVAIDDRFNAGGQLYRVKFVHPNRRAGTMAEAELIE